MPDRTRPDPNPDPPAATADIPVRPPPSQRIAPRALRAWRISGAITSTPIVIVAAGFSLLFRSLDLAWPFVAGPLVLAAIVTIVLVWLAPSVQWRRWRYEVTEREVELQRGVLIVTRTLIPMARVQHVDTRQGPILRWYNLATIEIATAAGTQQIPALAIDVADALRNRIAEFAGVADDV